MSVPFSPTQRAGMFVLRPLSAILYFHIFKQTTLHLTIIRFRSIAHPIHPPYAMRKDKIIKILGFGKVPVKEI